MTGPLVCQLKRWSFSSIGNGVEWQMEFWGGRHQLNVERRVGGRDFQKRISYPGVGVEPGPGGKSGLKMVTCESL